MKKLVVFCGSPRKNGICRQLLDQAILGAQQKGALVSFYDLNAPGLRGCQCCGYCRSHEGCALKDPLAPMYGEIAQADAILLAAPIYFHQISSQAKLWLDRMYPMFDTPSYQSRYPGKKIGTIFAQGFEDPSRYQSAIDQIHQIFFNWEWAVTGSLLSTGGSTYGVKMAPERELLDQAYRLGQALVE